MPLPRPAFFQSDRLPRWRAALAGGWIRLRLRFQHNPGFMTAAAAGSVGLVLTAILLLNGVLAFPGGKPAEPEVAEIAELGEPEETPADHFVASPVPPAVTNAVRDDREPVGVAADRRLNETSGDIIWNDDEPVVPALKSLAASGGNTISQFDRAPADDDPFDANDPPAQSAPADRAKPLLVANEAPAFADGASQPVELPDLTDESLKLEEEEPASKEPFTGEITEPANESDADMPPGSFSSDEPPTSDKDQRLEEFDTPTSRPEPRDRADVVLESDAEDETLPTVPRKPAAGMTGQPPKPPRAREILPEDDGQFIQPQTEPGWKYSTTDPPPARKEPAPEAVVKPAPGTSPGPAAQSRAVETAVYATPNAPASVPKTGENTPANESGTPDRLSLEIRSPKTISPGELVVLEFVITNHSDSPVKGASLSVSLPPGLAHPLGPDLEQSIKPLAGCQRFRTRLTVKATAAGDASPRAELSLGGKLTTTTTATLRVAAPGDSRPLDPCACNPMRPLW